MRKTYKALQVSASGELELIEKKVQPPSSKQVLIEVEACGMCGADISDIDIAASSDVPRVPGHEVVGRIAAKGEDVPNCWKIGQRVGVGRLGGHCHECIQCRKGQFHLCTNQLYVGATCEGGYAEMMLVLHTGLIAIPDELSSEEAAPILCAGLATFNALKKSSAQAGDGVAILGIGGLGHMAVQYARKMGFKVIAIGRGEHDVKDLRHLGAHLFIDAGRTDSIDQLKSAGGVQAIISTVPTASDVAPFLSTLSPQGKVILLGAGKATLEISPGGLVGGERCVEGSFTGTPYETERALDFSVLFEVIPKVETTPMYLANEALAKLRAGKVNYRMVLIMRKELHADCS
ncbi:MULTISPECIES: zinc-binding dehydrogenase [Bacteria]|jgi:alcohol dehydrogenase|uniref:alcohol dehydrogenase n=1 Tax=Merismopedia glauca CCAP 1448/3 TaxID=1296344 RepID=A0A2T1C5S8_9CYAN|nr:alcohol dehydrogenase catalytic domain-containing protein [Merismopedia glauca]PSB03619.1 alcohol dehydrogenase [Merismopedia glauca CCAP 1448/3]